MMDDSAEILGQSFLPEAIALLAWAGVSTLSRCPPRISSADHSVNRPPRYPEGWFWRGCRGMSQARTMQVSVSRQLPEKVPLGPQGT